MLSERNDFWGWVNSSNLLLSDFVRWTEEESGRAAIDVEFALETYYEENVKNANNK
jgi:hypothetical protein